MFRENCRIENFHAYEGGVTVSSIFFVCYNRIFLSGDRRVSELFWYGKEKWIRMGCHVLPSKNFCLMVPEIIVGCRMFRRITSHSIKLWYHCPRGGGRAEIHKKKLITPKLIKGRFNFGGGGVLLQNICLTL